MQKWVLVSVAVLLSCLLLGKSSAQGSLKKRFAPPKPTKGQCCDEVRSLKVQVANLTSMLEELRGKQEADLLNLLRQMMELAQQSRRQEERVTEAESKYSEINNRVEIMQMQGVQAHTRTSSGKTHRHIYTHLNIYKEMSENVLWENGLELGRDGDRLNAVFGRRYCSSAQAGGCIINKI